MRRAAQVVWVLVFATWIAVYVAAKIDFFRNYDPNDITGYLAGHWPFWLAVLGLAALGHLAARLALRQLRGSDTPRHTEVGHG